MNTNASLIEFSWCFFMKEQHIKGKLSTKVGKGGVIIPSIPTVYCGFNND